MSLGTRVEELRRDFDCSQREFAKILDVRQATISAWETEACGPSEGNLCRLAFLTDQPRAVAGWLREGGEKPTIRRHRRQPSQNNGTQRDILLADMDRWLERQALSIHLLREMEQLVDRDDPAVKSILRALSAAMSAAEGSRQVLEGIRLSLKP